MCFLETFVWRPGRGALCVVAVALTSFGLARSFFPGGLPVHLELQLGLSIDILLGLLCTTGPHQCARAGAPLRFPTAALQDATETLSFSLEGSKG